MTYFCIQLFFIINLLNQTKSHLGIIISASPPQGINQYKIFNCSQFKKPDKLYINGNIKENIELSTDNFIYIQSEKDSDNIVLVWNCFEDKGIIQYLNTSMIENNLDFNPNDESIKQNGQFSGIGLFQECSCINSIDFQYLNNFNNKYV